MPDASRWRTRFARVTVRIMRSRRPDWIERLLVVALVATTMLLILLQAEQVARAFGWI